MEALQGKSCAADIHLKTTGQTWLGDLEASGSNHIRLRLLPTETGALPRLAVGTSVDCAVGEGAKRFFAEGKVLKQEGAVVWLDVPCNWTRTERRISNRSSTAFPVSYHSKDFNGKASCVDIGVGGFRLRVRHTIPKGTAVSVDFILPGDDVPVRTDGLVLRMDGTDGFDLGVEIGVKFIRMRPADGARIAKYCHM